jgi:hypothetical protein
VTKVKSLFWLGVVGVVAVLGVQMLGDDLPSFRAAPRNHTPPHTYAVDDRRPRVIRLRADWDIPHTPARIMYDAGGDRVTLYDYQLGGGDGYWQIEMAYDPHKTYVLEVYQFKAESKATSCLMKVIDPGGFGFDDADVAHGIGTARCWVNVAT